MWGASPPARMTSYGTTGQRRHAYGLDGRERCFFYTRAHERERGRRENDPAET